MASCSGREPKTNRSLPLICVSRSNRGRNSLATQVLGENGWLGVSGPSGVIGSPNIKGSAYALENCKIREIYAMNWEQALMDYREERAIRNDNLCVYSIQHFLYFLPLPHGQGSFRPTFASRTTEILGGMACVDILFMVCCAAVYSSWRR